MAPVLGGVDRRQPRNAEPPRQPLGRAGHQPVMGVRQVERQPPAELGAEHAHVPVHRLDPFHELADVLRERRLGDTVHDNPVPELLGG